jgi:hypothetical protein
MMSFPLDYHGEIKWKGNAEEDPEQIQERFLKNINVELHRNNGNNIRYIDNIITFSGGIRWLRSNYNATAYITTGFVEITQADDGFLISYYLNFLQIFVLNCISTFICFFLFLIFIFAAKPPFFVVIVALAWIILMGSLIPCMGYPNAILRFIMAFYISAKKNATRSEEKETVGDQV